jgi:hypothetical protein
VLDTTAERPITEAEKGHKKIQNNLTNNKRKHKRYSKKPHLYTTIITTQILKKQFLKNIIFF